MRSCLLQSVPTSPKQSVINLTSCKTPPSSSFWVCLGEGCDLLMEDKARIESGQWLNDRIIGAWQILLRAKYCDVGGLYPPIVVSNRRSRREVSTCGIIQVFNCENSHWAVGSTIGCPVGVVHWLDSMLITPSSTHQLLVADLIQCPEDSITFEVLNVQVQQGGSDCGLFCLANTAAVLNPPFWPNANEVTPCQVFWVQRRQRELLAWCAQLC